MNAHAERRALVVITTVEAAVAADGSVQLTAKFVDGMARYAELWDGPVRCVCPPRSTPCTELDPIWVRSGACGFDIQVSAFDERALRPLLADAVVALVSAGFRQNHISALGAEMGVPVVYVTELTLPTRLAIARAEVRNPARLARRVVWEVAEERRQRQAFRRATGMQFNGTPTYDVYHRMTEHPLLYFDTRADGELIATDGALEARLARGQRGRGGRLRLGFSGRLVAIKGVDDLVRVAQRLVRRGVDFDFHIYGDGDRRPAMQQAIERAGLAERLRLCGAVDFARELVPSLRDEVDLFVCCHLQGDPSCTYVETMACGVPIVGYANEALAGLLRRVNAGQTVKLGDVEALSDVIARIARRREQLLPWSRNALAFARDHSFERTFERRIAHLAEVAGLG